MRTVKRTKKIRVLMPVSVHPFKAKIWAGIQSGKIRTGMSLRETQYIEVDSRFSTKTCSACGCLSGPSGFSGLAVREWTCTECGTHQDRDVNAALNTLFLGQGLASKSEIAGKHHARRPDRER